MKKILNLFSAALVCLVLNQTTAMASSHREAPLIAFDPLADNTDVYAFRSPAIQIMSFLLLIIFL